jgi:3',5'-cyclic AMP phosphodiesterase CpdA
VNARRSFQAAAAAAIVLLASCAGSPYRWSPTAETTALLAGPRPVYPAARFTVISDPHLYDAAALGAGGADFAAEIAYDRKMVVESAEILGEALRRVTASGVEFLLVAGDLTQEGELVNHERVASLLADVERSGVAVYVLPGNHDIMNPDAAGFGADGRRPVPGITPGDFAVLYHEFGYGEALHRDPGSLSYVAEPVTGLWLLGIDACRYAENRPGRHPVTGGRLGRESLAWIETMLAGARRLGKAVIVFMHHGLVEHFPGQARSFDEYLVEDHPEIGRMLAGYGVRTAFTGHFHSQDAVLARFTGDSFLFDVMTGSLATVPNVRFVTVGPDGNMAIDSEPITDLPSFAAAGRDFGAYAREFVRERIAAIAVREMRKMLVPARDAQALAPRIADAFVANYRGDERFTGGERLPTKGLSLMGRIVVGIQKSKIEGLWDDREPADNDLVIDLAAGTWRTGD